MKLVDVKNILKLITLGGFNIVDTKWDIKTTKLYDGGIIFEEGYSIRITFMRPDMNTGKVERGHGRWMYIPETVTNDGLVKTAWVCVDLIVKHELMESFLYDNKRIFDPHKSIKDLSVNSERIENSVPTEVTEENVKTSAEIISKQNLDNTALEIESYIKEKNFSLIADDEDNNITLYNSDKFLTIEHDMNIYNVKIIDQKGNLLGFRDVDSYTTDQVKELIEEHFPEELLDPAEVNFLIMSSDYTQSKKATEKEDEQVYVFIHKKKNKKKMIFHDQLERVVAVTNDEGMVITELSGENYTKDKISKIL